MVSGVPHSPQKPRRPNELDSNDRTRSAPSVNSKCPAGTVAKTIAGAPETNWQMRQWHQPASNGALLSA
jgi:hypothetical protein